MENHHFLGGNPLFLWPFSIAMLVYQRVSPSPSSPSSPSPKSLSYARSRDDAEKDDANEGQQDWGLAPSAVTKPQLGMASSNSSWGSQLQSGHGPPTVLPRNPHMDWRGERWGKASHDKINDNILIISSKTQLLEHGQHGLTNVTASKNPKLPYPTFATNAMQLHATSCNHLIIGWPSGATHRGMPRRAPKRIPMKTTETMAPRCHASKAHLDDSATVDMVGWGRHGSFLQYTRLGFFIYFSICQYYLLSIIHIYIYTYHIISIVDVFISYFSVSLWSIHVDLLMCACGPMGAGKLLISHLSWRHSECVESVSAPEKKNIHNSATGWWTSPLCLWICLAPMLNIAEYHIFCSADGPCTLRMGEFSGSSVHCQGADRVTDPEAPLVEWKRLQTIVALTCRSKL